MKFNIRMRAARKSLVTFFLLVPAVTIQVHAQSVVNVVDFGAVADDTRDDTKALRRAVAALASAGERTPKATNPRRTRRYSSRVGRP